MQNNLTKQRDCGTNANSRLVATKETQWLFLFPVRLVHCYGIAYKCVLLSDVVHRLFFAGGIGDIQCLLVEYGVKYLMRVEKERDLKQNLLLQNNQCSL